MIANVIIVYLNRRLKLNAACTIVSVNYLAQAKVLARSYLDNHPDDFFYILLVDRKSEYNSIVDDEYHYLWVEDIGIIDMVHMAFKYNVVEFNTSVKPYFLKYLFEKDNAIEKLLYIDPDIYIFNELAYVFSTLDVSEIMLTPHITEVMDDDGFFPDDSLYLKYGIYNLGFLGLKRSDTADKLLSWWCDKLSSQCFDDTRNSYFVDQKWIDMVPAMFDKVYISKNQGCNMAYWNLHERRLTKVDDVILVNNKYQLLFFHFSSVDISDENSITSKQERFDLVNRPDLKEIYADYIQKLINHGFEEAMRRKYTYSHFESGEKISPFIRKIYANHQNAFDDADPFSSKSSVLCFAKKEKIIKDDSLHLKYNQRNYDENDVRIRAIKLFFRIILRLIGPDKFSGLMKYLSYISIPINIPRIFIKIK
jgi:hypothetical protein